MVSHAVAGEDLLLHPSKAAFWERKSRLLLADVHLGKAGHFRRAGIPVPQAVAGKTLKHLKDCIDSFSPQEVWILGDLFHSYKNYEWKLWEDFLRSFPEVGFTLIPGNHDRFASLPPPNTSWAVREKVVEDPPFVFSHEPLEIVSPYYNIYGHIHPAVRMSGAGRQSLRLPCFWFQKHRAVLPAIGDFTGMYDISPTPEDQVYVVCENHVLPVE